MTAPVRLSCPAVGEPPVLPKMIPISLQLWSVRSHTAADFPGTIAKVAKAGFDGVETAGYGNVDAQGAAKAIADNGLKVSGMHVGIDRLRTELTTVAVEAHALGSKHIICPFLEPELFTTASACQTLGEELNGLLSACWWSRRLKRMAIRSWTRAMVLVV